MRNRATPQGLVPLTADEIAARDAECAANRAKDVAAAKQARIDAIKAQMDALDVKRIRPMAEKKAGDAEKLIEFNAQMEALREQLWAEQQS